MSTTLSPFVQRFAAIGLALAALLALFALVIEPAARRIMDVDSEIVLERERIARFTALAGAAKGAGSVAGRSEQLLLTGAYLPGETEAIQLANLQTEFRTLSHKAGVRHQATRTLQTTHRDGMQLVGLQASSQITIEALQALLIAVEANKPVLLVDGLDVAPVRGAVPGTPEERMVQVEMRVLAITRDTSRGGDPQ